METTEQADLMWTILSWIGDESLLFAVHIPIQIQGLIVIVKHWPPLFNINFFFAGEATHSQGHFGTVHGALETSERVVQEVLNPQI